MVVFDNWKFREILKSIMEKKKFKGHIVKREMKSVLWKENAYINQIMRKMRIGKYCGLFVMNERQKPIRGLKKCIFMKCLENVIWKWLFMSS